VSPVLLASALVVRCADPGPVLYGARRVGRGGRPFTLLKLRTMRVRQGARPSAITAGGDPRVFPAGRWLRRLKIDELPQLLNVVRGEMAIVGPRPEAPEIVERCYAPAHCESLDWLPGLTSVGSLYYYTHLEAGIDAGDPERDYAHRVLPVKLALDILSARQASLGMDARIVVRTAVILLAKVLGRKHFPDPPELAEAQRLGLVIPPRCS
jgi:lipopolysaccharide/colanic/teichoic acid biosynthesis glycosyltransferase